MLIDIYCPNCKGQLIKGAKRYYCSNSDDNCKFSFPVQISNRKISETELQVLISEKRLACNGFASKTGKLFSGVVLLENSLGKHKLDWPKASK